MGRKRVLSAGGSPFGVRKPTPETVAAMLEARAMSVPRYRTTSEIFDALDKEVGKVKARASAKKV